MNEENKTNENIIDNLELEQGGNKKLSSLALKRSLKALALATIMFIFGKIGIDNYNDKYIELNTNGNNHIRITENNSLSLYSPQNDDYVLLADFDFKTGTCANLMTDQIVKVEDFQEKGYYGVNLFDMIENGELKIEEIGHNKYRARTSELEGPVRLRYAKNYGTKEMKRGEQVTFEEPDYQLVMYEESNNKIELLYHYDLPLWNNETNKFVILHSEEGKKPIDLLSGEDVAEKDYIGSSPINIYNLIDSGEVQAIFETNQQGVKQAFFDKNELVKVVNELHTQDIKSL